MDEIKRAIMDYGPIAVGIRVGNAFLAYTGGIFNLDETGEVNHAVALVGWDDNQGERGVWILRNSWGTGWGEAGYMHIEYGTSQVGYAANYIVFTTRCLCGDINGNGRVDIGDAMFVGQILVGTRIPVFPPNDIPPCWDVNVNSRLDIGDAMFIAQYLVSGRDCLCVGTAEELCYKQP